MPLKGVTISKDIYRGDSYVVSVNGIPFTDCIKISQTSRKAKKVDLPDFTVAASTAIEPGELDLTFAAHSDALPFFDSWFNSTSTGRTPLAVSNTYFVMSITQISNSGVNIRTIGFQNCFIFERTEPEFGMQDADKMTEVVYKISYDECSVL